MLLKYLKSDTSLVKCFCPLNGIEEPSEHPYLNKQELEWAGDLRLGLLSENSELPVI